MTREEWLLAAIERLRPDFEAAGSPLPEKVRVSIGFPGGGDRRRRIGECWIGEGVQDGVPAVFVSPLLDHPEKMLGTLTHELVHAAGHRGHRGTFAKTARLLGLTPPWPASGVGEELAKRLHALSEELGPIDHAPIVPGDRKRQTTRMLKLECPEDGYLVRTTAKWIEVGYPSCPFGHLMGPA